MSKVVQEDLEEKVKFNDDEYLNDDGKRKKIIGNVYFNFKIRWIEILGPLCCRFLVFLVSLPILLAQLLIKYRVYN